MPASMAASLRQERFDGRIMLVGEEAGAALPAPAAVQGLSHRQGGRDGGAVAAGAVLRRPPGGAACRRAGRCGSTARRGGWCSPPARRSPTTTWCSPPGAQPRLAGAGRGARRGDAAPQPLGDAEELRQRLQSARQRRGRRRRASSAWSSPPSPRAAGVAVTVVEVADRADGARRCRPRCRPFSAARTSARTCASCSGRIGCGILGAEGGHATGVRDRGRHGAPGRPRAGRHRRRAEHGARRRRRGSPSPTASWSTSTSATSDPAISAIGDCRALSLPVRPGRRRRGSNRCRTPRTRHGASRRGSPASPRPYAAVPWFWSDQGDAEAADRRVARARRPACRARRSGRAGTLRAVSARRSACGGGDRQPPGDHMLARRLLARGVQLSVAQAREPGFQLKTLG